MTYAKMPKIYGDECFVFPVEVFQFPNFHGNDAKHDKLNCK